MLAVFDEGVGGEGDDGDVGPAGELPDGPRGGGAVQMRHAHVHQHQVVASGPGQLQGNQPVVRQHDAGALFEEEFPEHLPVDGVVFHQQDAGVVQGVRGRRVALRVGGFRGFGGRIFGVAEFFQGQGQEEGGALEHLAADADAAVHHLDDVLGDGEPEPGAAVLSRRAAVPLLERMEQPGHDLG